MSEKEFIRIRCYVQVFVSILVGIFIILISMHKSINFELADIIFIRFIGCSFTFYSLFNLVSLLIKRDIRKASEYNNRY